MIQSSQLQLHPDVDPDEDCREVVAGNDVLPLLHSPGGAINTTETNGTAATTAAAADVVHHTAVRKKSAAAMGIGFLILMLLLASRPGTTPEPDTPGVVEGALLTEKLPIIHGQEPRDSNCNCYASISESCCKRTIIRWHKMGVALVKRLTCGNLTCNQSEFGIDVVSDHAYQYSTERPTNIDYRDVFTIRNFYSTYVSGYDYHRLGHECGPHHHYPQPTSPWAQITVELGLPPVGNRTMCDYLAEEPLEIGVLLMMKWFYHSHRKAYANVLFSRQPEALNKTMIICFEDLVEDEANFERVLDHLFPGGHPMLHAPSSVAPAGDHGTSSVSSNKERVLAMVKHIDKTRFGGEIGRMADDIGCGI